MRTFAFAHYNNNFVTLLLFIAFNYTQYKVQSMQLQVIWRKTLIGFFIYGSFNDALSSSYSKAPNDRIINDYCIGKYIDGSGRDLI
jgi:hypothetical protein